jgi:predicted nucleic acid-binding protein
LIDDKKGRQIAEKNMVSCIGTLAILIKAKRENLVPKLKPLFEFLLNNKRYYQIEILNQILLVENEPLF